MSSEHPETDYDKEAYRKKHMEKKQWLNTIRNYNMKTDIRLMATVKKRFGDWGIGEWVLYEEWDRSPYANMRIDYRTTHHNEIVFDYDIKNWEDSQVGVKTLGDRVEKALEKIGITRLLCYTGGKGIHQHIFYQLNEGEYPELIQQMNNKHVMPKDIRLYISNLIFKTAGIPDNLIGHGKPIDTSCNIWEDTTKGHPVRVIGGAKIAKEDGENLGYKTLIESIPEHKPTTTRFTDVVFPQKIEPWIIPEAYIKSFLAEYKTRKTTTQKTMVDINYKGKWLNIPCIISIKGAGMPVGKRSTAAWALMLACRLDNLSEEQATQIAEIYYNRCDKEDFDFKEIENWQHWAYSKEDAFWNKRMCDMCREMGVCTKDKCTYWDEVKEKMGGKGNEDKEKRKRGEGKKHSSGYPPAGYNPPQLRKYQHPPSDWQVRSGGRRKRKSSRGYNVKSKGWGGG